MSETVKVDNKPYNLDQAISEFKRDLHAKSKNELIRTVVQLFIRTKQLEGAGEAVVREFNKFAQEHAMCEVSQKKRKEMASEDLSNKQ